MGAVHKGTFTTLVIKLRSCASCAGFELDPQTKNSRSQFFLVIRTAKGRTEACYSYLFGRDLATGDIWPQNYHSLLCHFTWVAINFHWLTGNQSNYMTLLHITHPWHIYTHVQPQWNWMNCSGFRAALLLPLFRVVFEEIYVKKAGGGVTPPEKLQLSRRFGFFSYWVCPSIWPSFTEISEMACITSAWSSSGHALNCILYF